ncbi:choice-of-anchor G family protein [Bacillus sp. S34]|nr:choice-of-anchor G family protein [Bacillus sp. S34]
MSNTVVVPVGANGKVRIKNMGPAATDYIVDLQGALSTVTQQSLTDGPVTIDLSSGVVSIDLGQLYTLNDLPANTTLLASDTEGALLNLMNQTPDGDSLLAAVVELLLGVEAARGALDPVELLDALQEVRDVGLLRVGERLAVLRLEDDRPVAAVRGRELVGQLVLHLTGLGVRDGDGRRDRPGEERVRDAVVLLVPRGETGQDRDRVLDGELVWDQHTHRHDDIATAIRLSEEFAQAFALTAIVITFAVSAFLLALVGTAYLCVFFVIPLVSGLIVSLMSGNPDDGYTFTWNFGIYSSLFVDPQVPYVTAPAPEPAPATISRDSPRYSTASFCWGFRPAVNGSSYARAPAPGSGVESKGSSTIVMSGTV